MPNRRLTTTQQGLGWEHQKRAKRMKQEALGQLCPLRISPKCTVVMLDVRLMDLDHSQPRALHHLTVGDRVVCLHCNRTAGARLGNAIRKGFRPPRRNTRTW